MYSEKPKEDGFSGLSPAEFEAELDKLQQAAKSDKTLQKISAASAHILKMVALDE